MAARRIVAYVLLKVEPGMEKEVVDKILQKYYNSITEARITYGIYDVVVRVEVDSMKMLDSVVTGIRKIEGVTESETLIAA